MAGVFLFLFSFFVLESVHRGIKVKQSGSRIPGGSFTNPRTGQIVSIIHGKTASFGSGLRAYSVDFAVHIGAAHSPSALLLRCQIFIRSFRVHN